MNVRTKLIFGGIAAAAVIGIGAGAGVAARGDDEKPLAGNDYDRATAAALEHVGGGRVTETEVGDDGAAYEVEVRLRDGSQVEVQLDDAFHVIGTEDDDRDDVDEGEDRE